MGYGIELEMSSELVSLTEYVDIVGVNARRLRSPPIRPTNSGFCLYANEGVSSYDKKGADYYSIS